MYTVIAGSLILTQRNEHNYMYYLIVQIIAGNNVAAKLLSKHTHTLNYTNVRVYMVAYLGV
jgi:hypothetical protein